AEERLWVAVEPTGLFLIPITATQAGQVDPPQPIAIAYNPQGGPASNRIDCMFRDREDTVWVGTAYYGLLRANKQVVTVYSKQNGLGGDNVYPVYQDRQGAVWIGSWEGRLTCYQDGKFTYHGVKTWLTNAFAEDREGALWIG